MINTSGTASASTNVTPRRHRTRGLKVVLLPKYGEPLIGESKGHAASTPVRRVAGRPCAQAPLSRWPGLKSSMSIKALCMIALATPTAAQSIASRLHRSENTPMGLDYPDCSLPINRRRLAGVNVKFTGFTWGTDYPSMIMPFSDKFKYMNEKVQTGGTLELREYQQFRTDLNERKKAFNAKYTKYGRNFGGRGRANCQWRDMKVDEQEYYLKLKTLNISTAINDLYKGLDQYITLKENHPGALTEEELCDENGVPLEDKNTLQEMEQACNSRIKIWYDKCKKLMKELSAPLEHGRTVLKLWESFGNRGSRCREWYQRVKGSMFGGFHGK